MFVYDDMSLLHLDDKRAKHVWHIPPANKQRSNAKPRTKRNKLKKRKEKQKKNENKFLKEK